MYIGEGPSLGAMCILKMKISGKTLIKKFTKDISGKPSIPSFRQLGLGFYVISTGNLIKKENDRTSKVT